MNTIPSRLDKYDLLERLGHGGVAEVWKAFDTQLQRHVALKILHPDLRSDPAFVSRFRREAQLIAGLHHPNIVQVHDFQVWQPPTPQSSGEGQTIAYMVMDYIEGMTLASYIRQTSGVGHMPSPLELVNLFAAISLAVDYAHKRGMIHRDIKPANILLDRRNMIRNPMGEPILSDFGIARVLNVASTLQTGAQFGTPAYISPEQIKGETGTERSDLYALGVILYEIATGVLPFSGDTPVDIMNQHLHVTPLTPSLVNPHLPPALTQVIMRSLSKDPAQRPASASAMTAAIARALGLPVPEILGLPAQQVDGTTMPTLRIGMNPSSPVTPILQSTPGISSPSLPSLSTRQPGQAIYHSQPGLGMTSMETRVAPLVGELVPTVTPPGIRAGTTPPPEPVPPSKPPRRRRGLIILTAVLLLALILGGLGTWLVPKWLTPPSSIVGQAFYTSSSQLLPGTSHGVADQIQIDLRNIPSPQSGKSYYVWLLGDKKPVNKKTLPEQMTFDPPLLLTNNLPVTNGTVHYVYTGTSTHENLLALTSRLLITEENAGQQPSAPSTDHSTWRYFAQIVQQVEAGGNLSPLDHIRHLLYNELRPHALSIPGGADYWMTLNTEKVLQFTVAARDSWYSKNTSDGQISQMYNHFISILDYIDGLQNVHVDLPAGTPATVSEDEARGSLLTVDLLRQTAANMQNPPGLLAHAQYHIGQVGKSTDIPPAMRLQTSNALTALRNATGNLQKVRELAVKLFKIANQSYDQMREASSGALLDDLVTYATYAYIGQLDPVTRKVNPGVVQAHYAMQQLTVLTVTKDLPASL